MGRGSAAKWGRGQDLIQGSPQESPGAKDPSAFGIHCGLSGIQRNSILPLVTYWPAFCDECEDLKQANLDVFSCAFFEFLPRTRFGIKKHNCPKQRLQTID